MAQDHAQGGQAEDPIYRFFGGPPLAVIGRLILLSILVGVVAAIGLDPWNIVGSIRRLILHLWTMGFEVVHWLGAISCWEL